MSESSTPQAEVQEKHKQVRQRLRRQVSIFAAVLILMTAVLTAVAFIVISTGKRFQSSELIPFAGAAVGLLAVFATLVAVVNEDQGVFLRYFRSALLGSSRTDAEVSSRARADALAARLRLLRLTKQLDERRLAAASENANPLDVDQLIRKSLTRLEAEISEVRRRGGINLAMGMSITLLGLGILGYAVYSAPAASSTPAELATYFIPRVSLALVTEMFAYFFLRLYKLSMNETKYFQNELTGAESRAMAVAMASKAGAATLVANVVKNLVALDRNHVLEKGQTTVEIEQSRIDSGVVQSVAGAFSRGTQRRKKGETGRSSEGL